MSSLFFSHSLAILLFLRFFNLLPHTWSLSPYYSLSISLGRIEKHILRAAFDTPEDPYLPKEILWRQKEQVPYRTISLISFWSSRPHPLTSLSTPTWLSIVLILSPPFLHLHGSLLFLSFDVSLLFLSVAYFVSLMFAYFISLFFSVLWRCWLWLDRFPEGPCRQKCVWPNVPECRLPLPWEHPGFKGSLLLQVYLRGTLSSGKETFTHTAYNTFCLVKRMIIFYFSLSIFYLFHWVDFFDKWSDIKSWSYHSSSHLNSSDPISSCLIIFLLLRISPVYLTRTDLSRTHCTRWSFHRMLHS